ncbi:MAG: DUF4340 domain-containing protein [Planctomycetes bacterium]|nr:DUF4340 domain-containing protein [Planctomycetota bacterium]
MNQKTLTLLLAATLVVGGLAALKISSDSAAVSSSTSNAKLLPELDKKVNEIASITLQRKDGTATLVRDASGGWGLAEKEGYPVDASAVRQSLLALAEMTPLEEKTDDPSRYEKLGLQAPDAEGSTSTLVTVKDKSGAEIAKVLVGKQSEAHGGMPSGNTYVRRGDEKVCWLAKGSPELKDKPTDWLKKQILEVKRDRIQSVEVKHADGELVQVQRAKPEDANFDLAGIPEGQELSYPTVAGSLAGALEYLNLEDVLPADKVDFTKDPGPTSEFRTFDGLKVTVHVKDEGDKCYARFEVAYEAPPQVGPAPEPAPSAEGAMPEEQAEEAKKSPEEVKKEASELQERLSKWAYVIPAYSKAFFEKHMKELVKAKTPPPAPPEAPNSAETTPADEHPADEKPH